MSENKNILIVDDEPKTRDTLKKLIQLERDHNVILAGTGNSAISILKEGIEEVDLVITDMYMPQGTGLDLITYIKQNKLDIDVILISGGSRSDDNLGVDDDHMITTAQKFGHATFIKKPFKLEEILEKIDSFFENK